MKFNWVSYAISLAGRPLYHQLSNRKLKKKFLKVVKYAPFFFRLGGPAIKMACFRD